MAWQHGLQRVRLTGTLCVVAGALLLGSNLATHLLGYAPDPSFASVFGLMWPAGLVLIILGAVLWITAWILQGFDPDHGNSTRNTPPQERPRPARYLPELTSGLQIIS